MAGRRARFMIVFLPLHLYVRERGRFVAVQALQVLAGSLPAKVFFVAAKFASAGLVVEDVADQIKVLGHRWVLRGLQTGTTHWVDSGWSVGVQHG